MKRVWLKDIREHLNQPVLLQGFVENFRDGKAMAFIVLKDISGKIQITIEKEKHPELLPILGEITQDSFLSVEGEAVESEYVKLNGLEVFPTAIRIESRAEALPIQREDIPETKKRAALVRSSVDERLDYRWIDLRTDKNLLLFQIQSELVNAMREYLIQERFIEIHTPKLIGAASESGSEVFEVKYFDRMAYLAQSPQFYKQMAMAAGLDRIFEVAPCFRAEKSFTSKHATEFTSFDLEMSYIESYHDVMKMEENLMIYALKKVSERFGKELEEVFDLPLTVPKAPFPVVTLKELYAGLKEDFGFEIPEEEQVDLTTEAERLSFEWVKKHYDHEFLFVTGFGAEKRAFYHMRNAQGIPDGYDLIWRGTEITTGAQREHRYEVLKKQAEEKGLAEDVKFYLEFFRYGCPPHGGFAVGVDRLTMLLLGMHINETMFLFRSPKRLTP